MRFHTDMEAAEPWTIRPGPGRVVATAIHDGHDLRPEVAEAVALGDAERLREEDPFTGQAVLDVPAHTIVAITSWRGNSSNSSSKAKEAGRSARPVTSSRQVATSICGVGA